MTALINGTPAISGDHVAVGDLTTTIMNPNVHDYLTMRDNGNTYTSKPKAYINAVLLDDQFKPVNTQDGKNTWFEQVGDNLEPKTHLLQDREITKNGYLYIYTSNETENIDVFFDNLQVTHTRGPLLEETHYYPFGLTMAGISSKALKSNYADNKKKFNDGTELQNKEFSDGSGLELYETDFRLYDPQIGRFTQIDELAEQFDSWSPFVFANNNPILLNDPFGLAGDTAWKNLSPVVLHSSYKKAPAPTYTINSYSLRPNPSKDFNALKNDPFIYYRQTPPTAWNPSMTGTLATAVENGVLLVIPWGRIVKGVGWLYKAAKMTQVLKSVKLAELIKLSSTEMKIFNEASKIMNSGELQTLVSAYEKGVSAEVTIGGRTILFEPGMNASGLTLFGEGSFVLGNEAFGSSTELGKTILHELYRLTTSTVQSAGATGAAITAETGAAFNFAEKMSKMLQ